jgi:hypothetical protein
VNSYLTGLEQLLRSGVDRIYSYNLRLFNGIDLCSKRNREKYQYKTMYRLPERTYGSYCGTIVTEVEEVVTCTSSFTFQDYLTVRKYSLFLELASGRGYLSELIQLMFKLGLPGEKLIRFFADHKLSQYPKLLSVVQEYNKRVRGELFETIDECTELARTLISEGKVAQDVKLNLIYTGKIMLDDVVRNEFFDVIRSFVRIHGATKHVAFFDDYLDNILEKQVVCFSMREETIIVTQSRISLDKIDKVDFGTSDSLLTNTAQQVSFTLHKDAMDFMQKKSISGLDKDDATLQDIYMTMSLHGLMRTRKIL